MLAKGRLSISASKRNLTHLRRRKFDSHPARSVTWRRHTPQKGVLMSAALTRRCFLAAASSLAALPAARSSMKLSITVRIAEAPGSNQKTTMGFEEVVGIARKTGYQ